MTRPIVQYGHAVLHRPASPVEAITPDIQTLVDAMIETMHAAPGVGLAAPQVGIPLRLFVIDLSVGTDPGAILVCINPTFVAREGLQFEEEGCLSIPGFTASVVRPERAAVQALDRNGQTRVIEGRGLLARALQHEMDHLDGVLFVDRIRPSLRRDLLRRFAARRQTV
ncbi:MAG TPA: peptide deformylase [Vicinamibacterales bacterium]